MENLSRIVMHTAFYNKKIAWKLLCYWTGRHWTPRGDTLKRSTCNWRNPPDKDWETSRSWASICSSWLWMRAQTRTFCTRQASKHTALILQYLSFQHQIGKRPCGKPFNGLLQKTLPSEWVYFVGGWKVSISAIIYLHDAITEKELGLRALSILALIYYCNLYGSKSSE